MTLGGGGVLFKTICVSKRREKENKKIKMKKKTGERNERNTKGIIRKT